MAIDNSGIEQARRASANSVAGRQASVASQVGSAIVATPTNSDLPMAVDRARELARVQPMNGPQPIVNPTSKGSL